MSPAGEVATGTASLPPPHSTSSLSLLPYPLPPLLLQYQQSKPAAPAASIRPADTHRHSRRIWEDTPHNHFKDKHTQSTIYTKDTQAQSISYSESHKTKNKIKKIKTHFVFLPKI